MEPNQQDIRQVAISCCCRVKHIVCPWWYRIYSEDISRDWCDFASY